MPTQDPFARRNPTHESVVGVVAIVALIWSAVYILWRVATTVNGSIGITPIVLLSAEILAVVVFAAHVRSAGRTPATLLDVPDAPVPDTTAVVDAAHASVDAIRSTLVSLKRVEGLDAIVVVRSDGSRWLRTVAERFNASVCEPSASVTDAIRGVGTNWALLIRAGDLPMPDLVTMCAARCSAPDVAVVQVATEDSDPTSFEHDADSRWTLEPFEQQVVRPSLAAHGSIPWYGDGPAMVRRSALAHLGDHALPAESRLAGLALSRAGFTVTHVPLTLARVRAAQGLGETLLRHRDRLRDGLAAARPSALAGVSRPTRVAHLLAVTPVVAAAQRLLLVLAAVLVLGFAQVPIRGAGSTLVLLAVPSYGLRWLTHLMTGRGRLRPLSLLRRDLRALASDVLPFRRSASAAGESVALVAALVAVLDVVVLVTAVGVWRSWPDQLPAETAAVALALIAPFLGTAMEVVLEGFADRHVRRSRRVRLGLVTCRIEEHDGQLLDLSTGGAGVAVPCDPDDAPATGETTTVSFRIPDADGAWRSVSALVTVVHRAPDPDGGTRLGLAFDDPTDAPLDPVIEFLTIDRRLMSLGRRSLVSST